jgi:cytochrome c biogenesis protein CcdA
MWFSPLLLGAMYGFAGFCSGPILGAILTVAASTERTLTGASLLAVYALGMSAPLFILASLWGRLAEPVLRLLRGREMTLGRLTLHTTNIVAGVLFVALGTLFILFDGTTGLTRWYDSAGLSALAHHAETWFYAHASDTTWGLGLLGVLAVISLITWGVRRWRAAKHLATDLYSKASFRERERYEKS